MRESLLISLFTVLLLSCSTQTTIRQPAFAEDPGELDFHHSQFRHLSVKTVGQEEAYFFYFEARSHQGGAVELNADDLVFKSEDQLIPYDFFRDDVGKYYYRIFFRELPVSSSHLQVFIRGELLSNIELKHYEKLASLDLSRSRMRVIRYENHTYTFELELLNSQEQKVQITERPEIFIEGNAVLLGISSPGSGKWQGKLQILDTNSIIYLSVRLNSNHLPRLLRIQHIEK